MKDKLRALVASVIIILYTSTYVFASASILGSEQIYKGEVQIADGTYYYENVFYSDQSGVGPQAEYYFEYNPNTNVVPVITDGGSVYGRYDIYQNYNDLLSQNLKPVAGVNGDFYSLQTGVPISHCISDGYIISKDKTGQDSVGFLEDGTAFIGWLEIKTTVIKDDASAIVENINKYRQPHQVYMFTEEFGKETHDTDPGLVVVLTDLSDKISIQGEVTATVESVDYFTGSTALPKDKIIISINDKLKEQDNYKFFESLTAGDVVTIKSEFTGDTRFLEAKTVMGGSQGRLLNKGVVNDKLQVGAAPRTAIGVREDGSSIFYTIDGRQTGHSYGVQLTTLAKRLKELGCVDAINLDGGGSTTCGVILPGYSDFTVTNSPSDGSVRKNSNFFFFVNNAEATGKPSKMFIYPLDMKILSGAKTTVTAKMTDDSFNPVNSDNIAYFTSQGEINNKGELIADGNGQFTVTAQKDGISSEITYTVYDNPTSIVANVESIVAETEQKIQLTAIAMDGHSQLISQNNCFEWSVSDEKLGSIDQNGVFTAGKVPFTEGNIEIKYNDTIRTIPVSIKGETDAPEFYHNIDEFKFEDGKITIKISNEHNILLDKSQITFKTDGEEKEFGFEDGILTFDFEDGLKDCTHRVSVLIKNKFDNITLQFFEIKGINSTNVFSDTQNNWAKDIIAYMNSQGVVNGYTEQDGTVVFKPQDNMTRAQFAVMISNYLKIDLSSYENVELPFADAESIPQWAINQVKAMYKEGIISGRQNGDTVVFDSNALLTRAEAAVMLSRILPEGLKKASVDFSDKADIPTWATDGIAVLVNLKALNGYQDNTILPNNNITRAECAKLLYSIF
ncbi:MAG: S-layer homology domain-containing protein [Clostridia bacterium]|nr:S-layer homology domain-containing protein [Clostridia bacterium]